MPPRIGARQQSQDGWDDGFERRARKKRKIERRHSSHWDDADEAPEKESEFGDTYAFDDGYGADASGRDRL